MKVSTHPTGSIAGPVLAICGLLLCSRAALAAGPSIAETGGADMGLGGAGRAALALDAAAMSANPAALAALRSPSATIALMPVRLDYEFTGNRASRAHATNHGDVTWLPAAYVAGRRGRWAYGFAACSRVGLAFDSGNDWGAQRVVERAGLATYDVGTAIAFKPSARWSVGGSIGAQWARPELGVAASNDAAYYGPPIGLPDGELKFSGSDWSTTGQLGITFEPRPGVRLGVSWTAPVHHEVGMDIAATNVHPVLASMLPPDGGARVTFEVPQQWLVGVARQWDDGTVLAAGGSWQDWSAFGQSRLELPDQTHRLFPGGLRDTWGAAVGIRHPVGRASLWSAGVGYESSPAPPTGVPAYFPAADQWRFASGFERPVRDTVRIRASFSMTRQGDAAVVQTVHPLPLPGIPALTGTYQHTTVYALGLGADFRF